MRRLRYVLCAVVLVGGVVAELAGQPQLLGLDAATGFGLVVMGTAAWSVRADSAVGPLLLAAGAAWFLGSVAEWAVDLHRGPLAHLLLCYPAARAWPRARAEQAAIVGAYAYALALPATGGDALTVVFVALLVAIAVGRHAASGGAERRARAAALAAALAYAAALAFAFIARRQALSATAALAVYDVVVLAIGAGLVADLLFGRWTRAAVTGLVVDLGDAGTPATLRDHLARAVGDRDLVVGYWAPALGRYVDESGRAVATPAGHAGRRVTEIEHDGQRVAIVIHDDALGGDAQLTAAIARATGLVVSNARLQAEIRERVAEVAASQRRIVEAADDQRARLELELRAGPLRRLERVGVLVGDLDGDLAQRVGATRADLTELAHGLRPAGLTANGLRAGIGELAERCSVPTTVEVSSARYAPAVEAAVFFVCSEALANVTKYARASRARVVMSERDGRLHVAITDDGVGGADPAGGSGLRGLTDRVEALGGALRVTTAPGVGTTLAVTLPIGPAITT